MEIEAPAPAAEAPDAPEEVHPLVEKMNKLEAMLEADPETQLSALRAEASSVLAEEEASEGALKAKEAAMYMVGKLLSKAADLEGLKALLFENGAFFGAIPKAKTAKIVRNILDMVKAVPDSLAMQVDLTSAVVAWCIEEKRTFLKHRMQARFSNLQYLQGEYHDGLRTTSTLLRELKKLDDKQLLLDTHLVEAKLHHALRNLPKSKAALTASRTAANSVYISPTLQAELDEMSGKLYCEEEDYHTAFSYFLESFEGFDQGKDSRAICCLRYMILCKILGGHAGEVGSVLSGKKAVKYAGPDLEGLVEIAEAAKKRSLETFKAAHEAHAAELNADVLIAHHLEKLYEQMLDNNLLKLIEPFSCVEIAHVAELINLPVTTVERKLGLMILDGKLAGTLDQGRGVLLVYEAQEEDKAYKLGLNVIENMDAVMSSLFRRAAKLH